MRSAVRGDGRLELRLPDLERRFTRVRLDAGLGTAGPRPELTWADGEWSVVPDLPPLRRLEYAFEIDGEVGERTALELPGYQPPAWTVRDVPPGTTTALPLEVAGVTATLWSPAGLDDDAAAPLAVVHDGPGYAEHGQLTQYLAVLAEDGVARVRALLLTADPRHVLYATSEEYARDLVDRLIPAATQRYPTTVRIAVGASLGALAVLHAQWRSPGTFDAMLLQSGSFFTPETDGQESGFARWGAVTGFVADVLTDHAGAAALPPVAITCGSHEENVHNNRLLAQRLREVGVPVTMTEVADLHNFTCWRDGLDPALCDLIQLAVRG